MGTARIQSILVLGTSLVLAVGSPAYGASTVDTVTITPDPAYAGDTLSCAWNFSDDEGDADASTLEWAVNGLVVGSSTALSGGFVGGDTVTCTVTASDGTDTGNTDSVSLTISNTAPVLDAVTMAPDPAFEDDTLTCTPDTATDVDGESVTYTYAWTVDGSDPGVSTDTLDGASFDRDMDVFCTVTPSDGSEAGEPEDSNGVTISNSVPEVSGVSISPSSATASDTLSCSYVFSDADGDADASSMVWTINGSEAGTSTTLSSGFVGGDTVACTVTPDDDSDTGTEDTTTIIIENTAPEVLAVDLSPTEVYTDDTFTVEVLGSDADGDSVDFDYAWYVNDDRQVVTSDSLDGTLYFDRGDRVRVDITPNDGTADGTVFQVTAIEIANTPPVLESVAISSETPTADDTLSCVPGEASDADDDEVSDYLYQWEVNGVALEGEVAETLEPGAVSEDSGDTGGSDTAGDTGGSSGGSSDAEPNFEVGDSVICWAQPVDDAGAEGDAVASDAVVIAEVDDDDTGTDTGTEDTGEGSSDTDSSSTDTADPVYSAADRAGETGGFGCASMSGIAPALSIWGALVLLAWRRRDLY